MEIHLPSPFFLAVCFLLSKGTLLGHSASRRMFCSDWTPYLDGKCVKILHVTSKMNQQEAEMACNGYFSRLITIKTNQQQQFLKEYLFAENKTGGNIWLGLKKHDDDTEFKWSDNSNVTFSNFALESQTRDDHTCVEMVSVQQINEEGLWLKVRCDKNNAVVCERAAASSTTAVSTYTTDISGNGFQETELEAKILLKAEKDCEEKFGMLKTASLQTTELLKEAIEKIAKGIKHVNAAPLREIDTKPRQKSDRSFVLGKKPSPCRAWLPYGNEKCIKIAYKAGYQIQEDSEFLCEAYSEELDGKSFPNLITVKTEAEQQFLQHFLFTEHKIMDDLWLGLKATETSSEYEWNDGGKVRYTNWAKNLTDEDHLCVAMASGKGLAAAGLWVKVHCERRMAFACEKRQTLTLEMLQSIVFNDKLEHQLQQQKWEEKISSLELKHRETLQTIVNLEDKLKINNVNLQTSSATFEQKIHALKTDFETELDQKAGNVPVGFIYVQYPNQTNPATLWPFAKWEDISSTYEGLFFRAVGGNSAAFGKLQEANDTKLAQVEYQSNKEGNGGIQVLPSDGSWTLGLLTGYNSGSSYNSLRFRLMNGEVRPKNTAVIIWQRVQ